MLVGRKNNRASDKSVETQSINIVVDKIQVAINRYYQKQKRTNGYSTAAMSEWKIY